MLVLTRTLSGYAWNRQLVSLVIKSTLVVIGAFLLKAFASDTATWMAGTVLFLVSGLISARGVAARLGRQHRLVALMLKVPCAKWALGKTAY